MVWGAVSWEEKAELVVFLSRTSVGADVYIERVIRGPVKAFAQRHPDTMLVQDGATAHQAHATLQALHTMGIRRAGAIVQLAARMEHEVHSGSGF